MSLACLILAAGQGTRMRSSLPKVLHPIAGKPMISHVIGACEALKADKVVVVIGPDTQQVKQVVNPHGTATQAKPQGTGDAVKSAKASLKGFDGDIIVLFGDTPLVTPEALQKLVDRKNETGASIVVGGFLPEDPAAYGRLIVRHDGHLDAIIEAADATPAQKEIKLCNGGIMIFEASALWPLLDQIKNDNAKKEYYLTDCVELANKTGLKVAVAEMPMDDVSGINTRVQLAAAEKIMQARLRQKHMLSGVTLTDPETVYFSADTVLGCDVTVGPNVVFGPAVKVADNVEIRSFCHLEGVSVEGGAIIGPFARLRPGSTVGENAHIGNFVEIKKARVAAGAKINHLSYIGDASVGAKTNIGAGTITCNYDGFTKSHTEIGAGVFIGSDTALVAPVSVGDGAIVAAGSIITEDVPADALAIARERQSVSQGWAKRFRKVQEEKKKLERQ